MMKICFNKVVFIVIISIMSGLAYSSPSNEKARLTAIVFSSMSPICRLAHPLTANCLISLAPFSGIPGKIQITNNSGGTATNIVATLPPGWSPDVTQNASACVTLPVGSSCIISFLAVGPPRLQQTIPVQGDNTNTVFFDMLVLK